jgi:uncharacterized membrane protein YfcA
LFASGSIASIVGSLVGLGGGFVVIPVLRIVTKIAPAQVAGTSLVFVLANVIASTIGYLRHKRVDLHIGLPIAAAAIPGSIIGVFVVRNVSGLVFDIAYGTLLVTLSILVIRHRNTAFVEPGTRTIAHRLPVAILAGFGVGIVSSVFGIGGGIVLVPLLLIAAKIQPTVVSATSGFIVMCTAPVGVLTHGIAGDIDWAIALPLVVGGLVGGSVAPSIAKRVASPHIVTLLAIVLMLAAAGLVLRHLV